MKTILYLLSIVAVIIFGVDKIRSRKKSKYSYQELNALHEAELNKKNEDTGTQIE